MHDSNTTPSPPPESPTSRPRLPPSTHSRPTQFQHFIQEAIEVTNPPIRHLASPSISSFGSNGRRRSHSRGSQRPSDLFSNRSTRSKAKRPLSTNYEEQRAGTPMAGFAKTTKLFVPEEGKESTGSMGSMGGTGEGWRAHRASVTTGTGSHGFSDDTTLYSHGRETPAGGNKTEKSVAGKPSGGEKVEKEETDGEKVEEEDETNYPGPLGLFILITGIALSIFLISLDRTIITTAIPLITNDFNSYDDIGWYGSAYLLTASAFQPLYGRIFQLFNMKWSYLISLTIFEVGSLLCAVSPNSIALIVGRSIQGLGSAGILTGSFVVVSHAVPLQQRPILTAVIGLMFGVGATCGPLLGGVFTDLVTWRWCFYVNLPIGGATFLSMILFFHPPKKHALMGKSIFYRLLELDLTGNAILLGAAVMLFLALQYTEQRVPWGSAKVVGLLTGSGVTFIVFVIWQWWKQDGALMPPRILKQRTVAASCAAAFFIYSAILIHTFYLPIWFQAVKGNSAILSGVHMIPYVLANAIFSVIAGIFVSKNGYFTIPAVVGMVIGTIGAGLLSTLRRDSSTGMWVGYEILASAGIGLAIQQGFTAVQIVLPLDEIAIGTAAVVAFQSLGGAIFVSVGNTILQNSLYDASIPGVDVQAILDAGASDFRHLLTAEQLPAVLAVYDSALRRVFTAAIPMAGLAVVACCFLEFRSVKDKKNVDEEEAKKARGKREEFERAILQHNRESTMSSASHGYASRE